MGRDSSLSREIESGSPEVRTRRGRQASLDAAQDEARAILLAATGLVHHTHHRVGQLVELDQNGDCAPLGDGASPVQPSCTPGHQESGIGGQGAHQVEGDPDQRVSDRGIQSLTPINGQDTEAGGQSTLIPPGDMGQQGAQVGGNWPGGSILRRDGTVLHTVGIRRAVAGYQESGRWHSSVCGHPPLQQADPCSSFSNKCCT